MEAAVIGPGPNKCEGDAGDLGGYGDVSVSLLMRWFESPVGGSWLNAAAPKNRRLCTLIDLLLLPGIIEVRGPCH